MCQYIRGKFSNVTKDRGPSAKLQLKESQVADLQKLLKQRDPETKVSSYSEYVSFSLVECFGYSHVFLDYCLA